MTKNIYRYLCFCIGLSFLCTPGHGQSGSLDPTFNPTDLGTGDGANIDIFTTAVQADGKIIIGGLHHVQWHGACQNCPPECR